MKLQPTKFIWMNGSLVKWDDAKIHFTTHTFHYGAGAFEGIRVYKTERGSAIFRLEEHVDRLLYSAKAISMEVPYTAQQLADACVEVLRENGLEQGYLRPVIYYGYGTMGVNPKGSPVDVGIACWPWGAYLPYEAVDVKVSSYIRIHPRSTVCDAKLNGHYVNSILASNELNGTKYHEALFLDNDGNVAEGPGENIFIIKNGSLVTPALGPILAGITRSTVLTLLHDKGLKVEERVLTLEEAKNGDEAFFTGTAAEITPIRSIDDSVIGDGKVGPLTKTIKDAYADVVYGRNKEYDRFLTFV